MGESRDTATNRGRTVVTGGAGFIGSHVVDALVAKGRRVVVVDDFNSFYDPQIKVHNLCQHAANPDVEILRCDILDRERLRDSIDWSDVSAVIHLAARAGVRPSILDPRGYLQTNVVGTQNLLDCCRDAGVSQFVFASSSSVYGVNPRVPWSEEDHVLQPISPYASTKIAGELIGHTYSHLYGMRFIALRFFTVYGPRQRPDLAIHKFAKLIREGAPVPFYGDGSSRRDYTYIQDIVSGILAAAEYTGSAYEVINLGNSATVSLAELVRELERLLGRSAVLQRLPMQPGDVPVTNASIEKASLLLGYSPCTSFEEGLPVFVDWLLQQK